MKLKELMGKDAFVQEMADRVEASARMAVDRLMPHAVEIVRETGDPAFMAESIVASAYLQGVVDAGSSAKRTRLLDPEASLADFGELFTQVVKRIEAKHAAREKAEDAGTVEARMLQTWALVSEGAVLSAMDELGVKNVTGVKVGQEGEDN